MVNENVVFFQSKVKFNLDKMATKKSAALVSFFVLFSYIAKSQQSNNTAGGVVTGNGGTVAYSIGQVVFTSITSGAGIITQGVHHAYEIYTVGIKHAALNISLTVFPNPVTENLTLQISDYNNEKMSYLLYDMHGKLVFKGQIIAQQTQINMYSLAAASYSLAVLSEGQKVKNFQIIKKH